VDKNVFSLMFSLIEIYGKEIDQSKEPESQSIILQKFISYLVFLRESYADILLWFKESPLNLSRLPVDIFNKSDFITLGRPQGVINKWPTNYKILHLQRHWYHFVFITHAAISNVYQLWFMDKNSHKPYTRL